MSETDLQRIERKIDMIIDHFRVGKTPPMSKKKIDDVTNSIIQDIFDKEQKDIQNGKTRNNSRKKVQD